MSQYIDKIIMLYAFDEHQLILFSTLVFLYLTEAVHKEVNF